MGSSTSSTTVAARSSVNSRNRSSAISLIISAEGIITGGGVTVVSSMTVLELVGEEICALRASSARRALRYAPRSPTLSYSSMKEEVMVSLYGGGRMKEMGSGSSQGSSFYLWLGVP